MSVLTGKHLIDGQWCAQNCDSFSAYAPQMDEFISPQFHSAEAAEVNLAVQAAERGFEVIRQLSDHRRSELLTNIAQQLEYIRTPLVARCVRETGLPTARVNGEIDRTKKQLLHFASLLMEGNWRRACSASSDVTSHPDLQLSSVPLGPVVVFSASNFPLAFSVAGGDTASALAAGCSVIVKAHPAHPGTSEMVADCILSALKHLDIPPCVFSLLQSKDHEAGVALVTNPAVKAVGFTGSIQGGRALFDIVSQRPEPIPFFGELGSTNPVFVFDSTFANGVDAFAQAFLSSMTQGAGQFCTSPGILVLQKSEHLDTLLTSLAAAIPSQAKQTMLTPHICSAYRRATKQRQSRSELNTLAVGRVAENAQSQAHIALFSVSAQDYLSNPELEHEVFGPSTLIVICQDFAEQLEVAKSLRGHLASSVFSEPDTEDRQQVAQLVDALSLKVGRLVFNGFATGVEISPAMQHGGPYPSSTMAATTSVGSRAIERFMRPVCFQSMPVDYLPVVLTSATADQ